MVSKDLSERDTDILAPWLVETTGRWDGDNGYWSTFKLSVGTPPQSFRLLPATIDTHTSVIIPEACEGGLVNVTNCGDLRGVDNFNGAPSRGFQWSPTSSSTSSTYKYFQTYTEYIGQSVFSATGPYGKDNLTLSRAGITRNIGSQIVAGVSDANFWLGTFGLGGASTNYTQSGFTAPSLLSSLKSSNIIPSISYGYTAGRYYDNETEGSLVLGGYDTNKLMLQSSVHSTIDSSKSLPRLNITIQGILAEGTLDRQSANVLGDAVVASIDSSLSHIYLPEDICDKLGAAYGLTYDETYQYYLVNDTVHDKLRGYNAALTFSLAGDSGTMTLTMPYKSLDMQVGLPWYQPKRNYFPIRKATNSSQVILGRTFLQEAYLVVDWEQRNFTLSQLNKATSAANIVAIAAAPSVAIGTTSATPAPAVGQSSSGGGIGAGAIAGIVVAVVVIAVLGGLFLWWRTRPKDKRSSMLSMLNPRRSMPPPPYERQNSGLEHFSDKPEEAMTETKTPHTQISELYADARPAELTSDNVRKLEEIVQAREAMSTPVAELGSGDLIGSELEDVRSNPGRGSITSGGTITSPNRASTVSPERGLSPPTPHMFELE